MRSLLPIWRMWCLAYFRWARTELTRRAPMHPDIPMIVMRIRDLEAADGRTD